VNQEPRTVNPFNRLPWRPRVDEEVEEELAFHIEMRTREYIARGIDPETARGKQPVVKVWRRTEASEAPRRRDD
jgi:hypothetical protein